MDHTACGGCFFLTGCSGNGQVCEIIAFSNDFHYPAKFVYFGVDFFLTSRKWLGFPMVLEGFWGSIFFDKYLYICVETAAQGMLYVPHFAYNFQYWKSGENAFNSREEK